MSFYNELLQQNENPFWSTLVMFIIIIFGNENTQRAKQRLIKIITYVLRYARIFS